jgi:non-homologous end joining protein Ku
MVAIAKAIIAQRTGSLDPTTYRDRYQEALRELRAFGRSVRKPSSEIALARSPAVKSL